MRDPLNRVRIRYKLPLGFLAICLVAFGVGGVVLTSEARTALEAQIQRRLDERAAALLVVVERRLALHAHRAEDFASDGFIRGQLEQLLAARANGDASRETELREELTRHLRENKLPLVAAFRGVVVYGATGVALAVEPETIGGDAEAAKVEKTRVGALVAASERRAYPTFRISTPILSLRGGERIGVLQLVLQADTWIQGMDELRSLPAFESGRMLLQGRTFSLSLPHGVSQAVVTTTQDADIQYERHVGRTGWAVHLSVNRAAAMRPADRLRNQYVLIGIGLLLLTALVMYFPVRYLLAPLSNIAETARRIGAGEFQARVDYESQDEIGDLARAFNVMARAIEDRTQELERAAGTLRRREQDIRAERNRLGAVIHSMEDGLFILDAEGTVTLANAAARPIVNALQSSEDVARRLECSKHGAPGQACLGCLANVPVGHQACVFECEGRIFEIRATTLPAVSGVPSSRLCVSRDVTQRLDAQETQAHQERMTVLGEMAAVMAHELNNPLAAISMFSQMLRKDVGEDSPIYEGMEVIQRNVKSCTETLTRLLDLSSRGALSAGLLDLHSMLGDLGRLVEPIFSRAGVEIETEFVALDPTLIADEAQLRQVFMNLLMNAVQASDRGAIVRISTSEEGAELLVHIEDSGSGVVPAVQGRIFEPFFTTKGAGVGTGLGLPTSRRIVREHGGELTLAATDTTGTTFLVRLPRQAKQATWRAEARLSARVQAVSGEVGPSEKQESQ